MEELLEQLIEEAKTLEPGSIERKNAIGDIAAIAKALNSDNMLSLEEEKSRYESNEAERRWTEEFELKKIEAFNAEERWSKEFNLKERAIEAESETAKKDNNRQNIGLAIEAIKAFTGLLSIGASVLMFNVGLAAEEKGYRNDKADKYIQRVIKRY